MRLCYAAFVVFCTLYDVGQYFWLVHYVKFNLDTHFMNYLLFNEAFLLT